MRNYGHGFEPRFKLEQAKSFYQQMKNALREFEGKSSMTKFLNFLDAFLAATRNVTFVFKKEFNDNTELMLWYDKKVEKWKKNPVMRLFISMRNISSKEHTPETLTVFRRRGKIDLNMATVKISSKGRIKQIRIPLLKSSDEKLQNNQTKFENPEAVVYFYALPKWFNESPDVMYLCKEYLRELGEFVSEVEEIIEREDK